MQSLFQSKIKRGSFTAVSIVTFLVFMMGFSIFFADVSPLKEMNILRGTAPKREKKTNYWLFYAHINNLG